jgi:adenine-specific DNA-methyltransferase
LDRCGLQVRASRGRSERGRLTDEWRLFPFFPSPVKGFVPTPEPIVDLMVDKLFRGRAPSADARVLDPGCGRGAFIDGLLRWCAAHEAPVPRIVGVDSNPAHVDHLRARFADTPRVEIRQGDFLLSTDTAQYDFIVGNPPYVPITQLSAVEREEYRRRFGTARGRFDLYLLFFEQALRLLAPRGRLVFITPEKYLYVETAAPLRQLLLRRHVDELHFLDEESFAGLVTYPLVTTVGEAGATRGTRVRARNGQRHVVERLLGTSSWMPAMHGDRTTTHARTLRDITRRVSCGVATGADGIYVQPMDRLRPELAPFARPTIAGRDITNGELPPIRSVMLLPYDSDGRLLAEEELGALGEYVAAPEHRRALLARTCVPAKPWYAFHETPPLRDILRPKILCKDIGANPCFVVDHAGDIVPRHSTYYIVPADSSRVEELAEFLNSAAAAAWLRSHCQRAAKGFLRVQSHVLKQLPLPPSLASMGAQGELTVAAAAAGAS